jgi:hypothetical protein
VSYEEPEESSILVFEIYFVLGFYRMTTRRNE